MAMEASLVVQDEMEDLTFEPELDIKYSCPVCMSVLTDPVQTRCGHRFCTSCLGGAARRRELVRCPVDNTWIHYHNDVFADTAVKREILSFIVLCPNSGTGCSWKGEYRELEEHRLVCLHAKVSCPCNCGHVCPRQDLFPHLLMCPNRLEPCQHCQGEVVAMFMTKHLLLHCPKLPVSCSLCGENGIFREDIPRHVDAVEGNCPQAMVNCRHDWLGCGAQPTRNALDDHCKLSAPDHLELLAQYVLVMTENQRKSEESLKEYKEKCDAMSEQLQRLEQKSVQQERTIEQLKQQISVNSRV